EIGTGAGVSAAWLLSGISNDATLFTCDIDNTLIESAQLFFNAFPNVEVKAGDWQQLIFDTKPFDLLFFDATPRAFLQERSNWDIATELINVGGQIVMDDLAPVESWPRDWEGMTDIKREVILFNPRIAGTEVRTTANTVSLVGTRIS
ncbi:MAG: class I SAM-dependent methyltransferase, partial [Candidatus Latescibacteria bacterium]|nr:class I SAM-dependent methyltransferase [Candidatus Latescibacterota bacterium]